MMAGWNPKSVTLQRDVHTAPRRSHCTETFTLHRDVHTGYEQRGSNEDLVWRWRRALGDGSESACTATYALIYTLSPVAVYSKQVSIVLLTRL